MATEPSRWAMEAARTIAGIQPTTQRIKQVAETIDRLAVQPAVAASEPKEEMPLAGDGWTRPDGEEFFGKAALREQEAYWERRTNELCDEIEKLKREISKLRAYAAATDPDG